MRGSYSQEAMLSCIQTLIEHNFAMRNPLIRSMKDLSRSEFTKDFGVGWGSIRNILVHLLNTEGYWLSVLKEEEFEGLYFQDFEDLTQIQKTWSKLEKQTREFVGQQNERSLLRLVRVEWSQGTVSFTVAKALIHMTTHEVHHRGVLVGLIRQLGRVPPDVNML
jgi:uncharacterized damage-inducible protein DinB